MPRVLMNFQHYQDGAAHFIEADCRTTIGRQTGYFHFATEEGLRSFVSRATSKTWLTSSTACARGRGGATTAN